jgi:fumarate hydratase subunit beta
MEIRLTTPLYKETLRKLKAGDSILLSGTIYTARDAAHERLSGMMFAGQPLPIPLEGQIIYYAGPTPARPGFPVGSLGPTTSGRMDAYAPKLIEAGLSGMIGKGKRSEAVKQAMNQHGAVYFGAIGGAGALLAQCVVSREVIAFPELQSEAIAKLTVVDFPCVVVMDTRGNDLYESGPKKYLKGI